jgi:transcriptional regulator with XRE-family HTH domain
MGMRRGRMPRDQSRFRSDAERLASMIRSAREAADLSQEALAHAAGVSVSTVRKIETGGVVEPGFFPVMSILRELGVDANIVVNDRRGAG